MSFIQKMDLDNLSNFSATKSYLAIAEREEPKESNIFFKKLIQKPFSIGGQVFKQSSINDIKAILEKNISINSVFNGITITIDIIDDSPTKIRLFALRSFGESLYHSVTDACLEFGYKNI